MVFTIRYQFGTYSGTVIINAADADSAIAKAKAQMSRDSSLPMAYQSYKIVK